MICQYEDRDSYELLRIALRDRFGNMFGRSEAYHHRLCWNVYLASNMSIQDWDMQVNIERARLMAKR